MPPFIHAAGADRAMQIAGRCDRCAEHSCWHQCDPAVCCVRRQAHRNRQYGRKRAAHSGFTLIEIIAVVALIALALTVVSVSVGTGLSGARVKAASRDLVAALRYTRGQAIVKREEKTLSIDVENRRYQAPGKAWVELPKDMTMDLLTTRDELEEEGIGRIRFFPDGSSTGGHVDLIRDEVVWRVQVQWLTGEVKLHENVELR